MRRKEVEKEKVCRKREGRPKARQTSGESGRWLFLLLLFFWVEMAMCQRCGGTAEKDGGDGKDAAGSSGKRRQMGRGDSTKVEAAGLDTAQAWVALESRVVDAVPVAPHVEVHLDRCGIVCLSNMSPDSAADAFSDYLVVVT